MQENNLKGLWIPYEILTNEHLSDKEKYIYSLILFFSKNDGYCTITNKYLATIVNLSNTRVSKLISSLSKKNYVQVITNFQDTTRQIINRKIIPLVKYDNPTYSKSANHIDKNNNNYSSKDTTTLVENNKYINNNKYNNYKNRFNDNRRIYSAEDFELDTFLFEIFIISFDISIPVAKKSLSL